MDGLTSLPSDAGELLTAKIQEGRSASNVIADEVEAIIRRRAVAFPQPGNTTAELGPASPNGVAVATTAVPVDLVGLALSGGGIRSAMFNLGLLQALHHNGLLRYADYLSTVSGGTYIGAHFSSLMLKLQHSPSPTSTSAATPAAPEGPTSDTPATVGAALGPAPAPAGPLQTLKDRFPLKEERFRPQNDRVLKFIRTGSYLDRPWDLVAHYVSGLFLNLLFFTSALIFVCALVAFVWRLFDLPWVRDALYFGQEDGAWTDFVRACTPDLVRAFVPALLCWGIFGVVKLLALTTWARAEWRPYLHRVQTIVSVCAWLSILVAVTVLMGNGNTSLGIFRFLFPESWLTYNPATGNQDSIDLEVLPAALRVLIFGLISGINITVVARSVLPLLIVPAGPKGKKRRPGWLDNLAVRAGLAGVLCGVPLVLLFFLARENVSGEAPAGKALQVNYAGPAPDRPRLLAVRLTPYDGQDPGDQELARIRLIFNRDLDLGWVTRQSYFLNSPWDGATPSGDVQSMELAASWDSDRPRILTLEPKEKERLPADRFWLSISGTSGNTPPVTGIGIANWADVERLATKTEGVDQPTLIDLDQALRWKLLWVGGLVLLLTGITVNFNWTSLHRFYRDRLTEAYIEEAIPGRGRKVPLSRLGNVAVGAPYHLISGAHMLIGNRREPERTYSFLFSAKYCGSTVTGFWPTRQFLKRFDDLGEVTALSGAALTPAQARSLPLLILMTTVNLRLGQWLPHPARRPWLPWPSPLGVITAFLRDAEDRPRCFVADGGHDENLGLWPLVQRRCRLIIVSDASQDAEHSFDDFLKFCRRTRLQSGIEFVNLEGDGRIDFKTIELRSDFTTEYHYFVGRVLYPADFPSPGQEAGEGFLIYLKPSMTLDEDPDLLRHFKQRRPFPHDPTLDQLFDEDTVESYRQLGSHIGGKLGQNLPAPEVMWDESVHLSIDDVKSRLVSALSSTTVPVAAELSDAADLERDWQSVHEILQKHESSPNRLQWLYEKVEGSVRQAHVRLNEPAQGAQAVSAVETKQAEPPPAAEGPRVTGSEKPLDGPAGEQAANIPVAPGQN
jgi:hypothetical protein